MSSARSNWFVVAGAGRVALGSLKFNLEARTTMNHDGETSDDVTPVRDRDTARGMDDQVGATIRLWRAQNRIWPAFPTLVLVRAASRLGRRGPAIGQAGVVNVFLDGSKVGAISPKQVKVYQVSPGEHSLSLQFLAGLRRSRKLSVSVAEGEEKQIVCLLNAFAWPSVRLATPKDVAAMEG